MSVLPAVVGGTAPARPGGGRARGVGLEGAGERQVVPHLRVVGPSQRAVHAGPGRVRARLQAGQDTALEAFAGSARSALRTMNRPAARSGTTLGVLPPSVTTPCTLSVGTRCWRSADNAQVADHERVQRVHALLGVHAAWAARPEHDHLQGRRGVDRGQDDLLGGGVRRMAAIASANARRPASRTLPPPPSSAGVPSTVTRPPSGPASRPGRARPRARPRRSRCGRRRGRARGRVVLAADRRPAGRRCPGPRRRPLSAAVGARFPSSRPVQVPGQQGRRAPLVLAESSGCAWSSWETATRSPASSSTTAQACDLAARSPDGRPAATAFIAWPRELGPWSGGRCQEAQEVAAEDEPLGRRGQAEGSDFGQLDPRVQPGAVRAEQDLAGPGAPHRIDKQVEVADAGGVGVHVGVSASWSRKLSWVLQSSAKLDRWGITKATSGYSHAAISTPGSSPMGSYSTGSRQRLAASQTSRVIAASWRCTLRPRNP